MKALKLFDRLSAFKVEDLPRALSQIEVNIQRAFERLTRAYPPSNSLELRVTFAAGSASSAVVQHDLNEAPNRFALNYIGAAQSVCFADSDVSTAQFTRSATTGDVVAYVRVWRDPSSGDLE